MDKIAIISDIHGNLEALKCVLEDIKAQGITHIYCLGDLAAKGVHTHQCIALIREHCEIVLQGNCDTYICNPPTDERLKFNHAITTQEDRDYLKQLPTMHEFYLSGSKIRLFHATPTRQNVYIGRDSKLEDELTMFYFNNEPCDIAIYGHTHTPYVNKQNHHTLINCGSVGNSMDVYQDQPGNYEETCQAYYLILEGSLDSTLRSRLSYQFIRIPYDINKELSSPIHNPEKDAYEKELRYGIYRDLM